MVKKLLLTLLPTLALGQGFTFVDTAWVGQFGKFDPTQIQGMAYYWNYNDAGAVGVEVKSWTDRIQSLVFTQASGVRWPTNTSQGVFWTNTATSTPWLTNKPAPVLNGNMAVWIVFAGTKMSLGAWMGFLSDEGATHGYYINGTAAGAGTARLFPSGNVNYTAITNIWYDWVMNNTNIANGGFGWTNTIATGNIPGVGTTFTIGSMGNDSTTEPFVGWIKFIGVWTNKNLTISDATSLYGYSTTH